MISFIDMHKINARFEPQFKAQFQAFLDSGYYILGNKYHSLNRRSQIIAERSTVLERVMVLTRFG